MKNLDQIKEEYATSLNDDYGTYNWQSLISGNGTRNMEHHHDAVAKLYAKEVAKESLKNATENAIMVDEYGMEKGTSVYDYYDNEVFISKESILNESNIPKL